MRILVSGAHGLVGTALGSKLLAAGHTVSALTRSAAAPGSIRWDPGAGLGPEDGQLAAAAPEGVIHLAGESLRARRWTARKKERIRASRVQGMRLLCDALLRLRHPPRVLVNASAIGYYGDRGDEILTEASAAGTGFLATVCQELETESARAAAGGIRVVNLRLGLVLSARGGAMDLMLPPFRLGIGGRFGGGRQYMSWITLDDVTAAIQYCIDNHAMTGPVNLVAPRPATNAEFVRTLGRVLHRPAVLPLPAGLMRILMGELADELLLASQKVQPQRLLAGGFVFGQPDLEPALRSVIT